jgi:hypothetical protein
MSAKCWFRERGESLEGGALLGFCMDDEVEGVGHRGVRMSRLRGAHLS